MFLTKIFGGRKREEGESADERSKSLAKSRLQFVLVQDRAGMSSDEIAKFKKELMGVIEKYFKIEANKFDITYKRDGELTTLLINSPVVVKRGGRGNSAAVEKEKTAPSEPPPTAKIEDKPADTVSAAANESA